MDTIIHVHKIQPIRKRRRKPCSPYSKYKKSLRKNFNRRCGYCDDDDFYSGGSRGFQIDHFAPKSKYPKLKNDYKNLVYCCPFCNRSKHDKWPLNSLKPSHNGIVGFVDPCSSDFNRHLARDSESGRIIACSKVGEYMIREMHLNLFRHKILWILRELKLVQKRLFLLQSDISKLTENQLSTSYCLSLSIHDIENYLDDGLR